MTCQSTEAPWSNVYTGKRSVLVTGVVLGALPLREHRRKAAGTISRWQSRQPQPLRGDKLGGLRHHRSTGLQGDVGSWSFLGGSSH